MKLAHYGIDLRARIGTSVHAVAFGVVSAVREGDGIYGNYVEVDHGNGYKTWYAHLSSASVSVGNVLNSGDQVGLSGNTGRRTAAHLHFAIFRNSLSLDPAKMTREEY